MTTLLPKPAIAAPAAAPGALAGAPEAWPPGAGFEIEWSCTRRAHAEVDARNGQAMRDGHGGARRPTLERVRFVLAIEPIGEDRAVIEAWLASDTRRLRWIQIRRHCRCAISRGCDGVLHVDVRDDDGVALAAVSIAPPAERTGSPRLLYARSALLAEAGFGAGACDAPALCRRRAEVHASESSEVSPSGSRVKNGSAAAVPMREPK